MTSENDVRFRTLVCDFFKVEGIGTQFWGQDLIERVELLPGKLILSYQIPDFAQMSKTTRKILKKYVS